MKRLLAIVLLALLGTATAAAQSDSIAFDRGYGLSAESMADATMQQLADLSFPTEMAVGDMPATALDRDNRVLAAVLAIVLGDFGIHHFYTGDIQHGILHAVFCWTGLPAIIGIIEGIMWLTDPVTFPDSLF